ncbi:MULTISPECIES: hypothetical protein [Listeria]|uniref:DNA-binding protein n=1 Tax=Listeria booriae TaxID=1552123 RepID=A0A7X1D3L0_9LIST|nr:MULTISPECIES: hypothetical protein [Listeria]MBC1435926.1 hypothetical protein [Listeria rocourtiae]MBC2149701.1 hypothetical protein [Listeria booriae]MBC2312080.1 hypothetical protein [Listeria booriae]MBC6164714.1 hypothetical protein [Listeria booriae]MBC6301533.1 hypothetical protein [Listeria booriae]
MDKDKFVKYGNEHLLTTTAARKITGQSARAFQQSLRNGHIKPIFEFRDSEKHVIRLYFRDDVEAYKVQMSHMQAAQKKRKEPTND